MEKKCAYCELSFSGHLIQCTHCGRPYDPANGGRTKVDWQKMSTWEKERYIEILEWEQRAQGGGWLTTMTSTLIAPLGWTAEKVVPDSVMKAIMEALERALRIVQDSAQFIMRKEAVFEEMAKAMGIATWEEVRARDLRELDALANSYSTAHKLLAALEGAGTGAGGLATAAVDIPALSGISLRYLSQLCYLHGRDPENMSERAFMLHVLQFGGTGGDQSAKVAIMKELNDIAIAAAKDWTWKRLDKSIIVQIIKKVCEFLGVKLTKQKLLQLVPILGGAVGAGVNYTFVADLAAGARNVYGKRFLYDKYLVEPKPGAA